MNDAKSAARSATTLLLGWLVAGAALASPAPPIRFQRLSIEEGLSQSTVLCLFQDHVGYLWLGTEDGLNRYDGYSFTVFKHDLTDPNSLPASFVWAIDEDPAGDLWLATDGGGLVKWERATGRFLPGPATSSPLLRTLRLQGDTLWIGTRQSGLDRLDLSTGQSSHFAHDPADPGSLSHDRVYVVHADRQGRVWVGTDGGLDRFDPEARRFVRVLPGVKVRAVDEDPEGGIWVGTGTGLWRVDPDGRSERFQHDPEDPASLGHDQVRALLHDTDGRLWVGTAGGLELYDPRATGFMHYRHDRGNADSLADDYVLSLVQDRGGILWVGTRLGGVHKWNPLSWQFGHVAPDPADPQGLASGRVTSFAEDRAGRLWIGTFDAGLAVMERRGGEVERFRHDPQDSASLSSDRVMALLHDHRGLLWVGTLDGGLNRFDPGSGAFKAYRHDPEGGNGPAAPGVMSLLEDRQGLLWIGTFGGGLSRFDPRRERFTHFRNDPAVATSLSADRVTSLAENPDGRLWVGTDGGGLNFCDFAAAHCQRFSHSADDPASLPSEAVYSLRLDDAGGVWAGTRNGLAHLAPGASGFTTYTTRQGLPNDVVYGILPDRQGRLWLSTNNGIASFDPGTGRVRKYGPGDGLQASEFNFGAAYGSLSGELFFGGINGFNAFFPERLRSLQRGPQVVLTAVSGGRLPSGAPPDQVQRLELGFRDDRVEFEFSALDFAAPERNRFAYMLEGFDRAWLELSGSRRVTYTNLDPGRYTLRVRAANVGDVWSAEDLAVALDVAPAPWATSWALLGYSSAFLGGLLGMARMQQRRQERRREYTRHLEREVEERTRELAERQLALERVNHELTKATITDSLTGLPNRRFLVELMDREVGLVHRRRVNAGPAGAPQSDLAFLMIDLDDFKAVNDTAGHVAGDNVMRQMQGVLHGACRNADIAIRWGGDEFLVVARGLDGAHLDVLAERVRARVAEHVFDLGDGRVARLTCSIGFASYPFHRERLDALTWEQVVSVADRALYVAKASGRNVWVGLAATEQTPVLGLLGAIRNDLRPMVDRRQLHVTTSLAAGQDLELA